MAPDESALDRYFWARHANPKSGWSRTVTLPLLLTCIYRRNWRGLALTVAFVVVNPFLFGPPEDDSAWMTRAVYGERHWSRQDHDYTSYPDILTVGSGVATLVALFGAVRQRPTEAALAGALSMALKFLFVAEMVRLYEDSQ